MKFSKKVTNKLVSYADRYFTYDCRIMRREDQNKPFDFCAYREDATVVIDRSPHGYLYLCIKKDKKYVYQVIVKSFAEIKNFKRMISCLG